MIVSDAQLVLGLALFVFGKSVRWVKKDRLAAAAAADVTQSTAAVNA